MFLASSFNSGTTSAIDLALRSAPGCLSTSAGASVILWLSRQPLRCKRLTAGQEVRMRKGAITAVRVSGTKPITGRCLCGAVQLEIDFPARWAWHDHSHASRLAHGAVYATYVGSWRKRFRIAEGEEEITRFEDQSGDATRSFCCRCGTPLTYERRLSPHMVNIPRALFLSRTGRQPLYHSAFSEFRDWAYTGGPLVPLKGFPGIVWERPKRRVPKRPKPGSVPKLHSSE
jgi:hypothetical protein